MIESINIKNFMSHKETELKFCDGMNVIVGPTDQGKSAIMAAILWAVQNKPSGDAFRSDWGGTTEVSLKLDDGIIARKKTQGSNLYLLGEEQFSGFGMGVPGLIQDALKISDINIHRQGDPPFLISEPSGRLAQYLNELVGLSQLDNLISILASWHRDTKSELAQKQAELKSLKEEEREPRFSCLSQAETILSEIRKEQEDKSVLVEELEDLTRLIQNFYSAKSVVDSLPISKIEKAEKIMEEIVELENKADTHQDSVTALSYLINLVQAKEIEIPKLGRDITFAEEELHKAIEAAGIKICPECGQEIRG